MDAPSDLNYDVLLRDKPHAGGAWWYLDDDFAASVGDVDVAIGENREEDGSLEGGELCSSVPDKSTPVEPSMIGDTGMAMVEDLCQRHGCSLSFRHDLIALLCVLIQLS